MKQIDEVLALLRDDALDVATELEELAAALRVVALGGATSSDVDRVRDNLNHRGEFVVEAVLVWELLFAHGSDELLEGAS